jgi:hypothetical protein
MWPRIALALVVLAGSARAEKKPMVAVASGYARAVRGMPPPYGKKTMKFLTAALWTPMYANKQQMKDPTILPPPKLRLVDQPGHEDKPGERTIVIKRMAKQRGTTIIEIDNEVFGLAPCKDRKLTTCLTPRPDLSLPENDS